MGEMSFTLSMNGGRYYHAAEGQGRHLTLTKAALGAFVFGVLSCGGEIIQLWPFKYTHPRCTVYPVVAMTPAMKEQFEKDTGFLLADPPKIQVD